MKLLTSSLAAIGVFAASLSSAAAKSGPVTVAYIEVNSNNITDTGKYTLTDGSNAFDIAVIFAANIKAGNGTATPSIYYNPNVQAILDDPEYNIKPLQAKGVKVVLSLLGGGEGVGIANLPNQTVAANFAKEIHSAVTKYGLDGIDFDDEYAEYGTNGTAQPNDDSFSWLLTSLRANMPKKLITFYNIGPAADSLSSANATIGRKVSYSFNPYYGSYEAPSIPGLTKAHLSPAAVQIGSTPMSQANSFAKMTVKQGYGAYMTYNLGNGNSSAYVSAFTKPLYGMPATYNP